RAQRSPVGASARRRPDTTASALFGAGVGGPASSAAAMVGRTHGWWSSIMSRIVSVWLPRWPIQRFLIAQKRALSTGPADPAKPPVDPAGPFVLAAEASGGPCIAALNAAAEALGLAAGERLSDARARAGFLQVRPVEPAADEAALRRLALWATRYTPAVAPWDEANGADGFFLEITGAGHLLGGEDGLLADLASRLARFGLSARIAIAGTAGAA